MFSKYTHCEKMGRRFMTRTLCTDMWMYIMYMCVCVCVCVCVCLFVLIIIAQVVVLLYIHLFGVGDVSSEVHLMFHIQQSHLIHFHRLQSISRCVLKKKSAIQL